MFGLVILAGVAMYTMWYQNSGKYFNSVSKFWQNPYYPHEGGTFDERWSRVSNLTFDPARNLGREDYNNPKRYRSVTESRQRLSETDVGDVVRSRAVQPKKTLAQINATFNVNEYPLLDTSRQDISKGRKRRSQNSFYKSD